MARSVEDLALFFQATVNKTGSPCGKALPIPFNQDYYPLSKALNGSRKVFKVGYCLSDGFLNPTPPVRRAVIETLRAIQTTYPDAEIVPFSFDYFPEFVHSFYKFATADGNMTLINLLHGEPTEKTLIPFFISSLLPRPVLKLASRAIQTFLKDDALSRIAQEFGRKTVKELWTEHNFRSLCCTELMKAWNNTANIGQLKQPIDFLVYPAFATPAIPHGTFHMVHYAASYTFVWNIADYPAGVIPVTTVQDTDTYSKQYDDKQFVDSYTMEKEHEALSLSPFLHARVQSFYEKHLRQGSFKNAPVGVQIIAPKFTEEKLLYYMKLVDDAVKIQRSRG
jgi:Asp-tRNA(Asn)/Glu-tRNA(Gln) amidotransferase A subunit family amidase